MQLGKRLGAGLLGGAIGLVAMEIVRRTTQPLVKKRTPIGTPSERTMSPLGAQHERDESATDALGRIGYQKLVGRAPSPKVKSALSWAVHIAYGLGVAALYGAVRGTSEHVVRDGALFGTGLWLLGDELAVPLLGLSDKPTAYHASQHAQSFAQHLGFGVGTAAMTHYLETRQ